MSEPNQILLETRGLAKSFHQGGETLNVLHDIDMSVRAGEIVALVGPSGSGKSTFLQMIGLLDTPTSGRIFIGGTEATGLDEGGRTAMRRGRLGFVYQFHYLLPEFSALENVVIPQMIAGTPREEAGEKGAALLTSMGLGHRLKNRPARLSGGEQQRVARALANRPAILLADEPTGNLDPETSESVFALLLDQVRGSGVGALIATHNLDLAKRMDRILTLKGGRLV